MYFAQLSQARQQVLNLRPNFPEPERSQPIPFYIGYVLLNRFLRIGISSQPIPFYIGYVLTD